MKKRYDKTDDVLMIWFSKESVDYAEQTNDLIVHFSKQNKPVLLEILNASKFLTESSNMIPQLSHPQMSAQ